MELNALPSVEELCICEQPVTQTTKVRSIWWIIHKQAHVQNKQYFMFIALNYKYQYNNWIFFNRNHQQTHWSSTTISKGYTKNHAIKKMPIPSRTIVKCGKTAGLIGLTYRFIDSMAISWRRKKNRLQLNRFI